MVALNAGRALLQACKQGASADIKACTTRLLAIPDIKEINPAITMAIGTAAYNSHANALHHLITNIPQHHWQGNRGP